MKPKLTRVHRIAFKDRDRVVSAFVEPIGSSVYLEVDSTRTKRVRHGEHTIRMLYTVNRASVNRCLDVFRRDVGLSFPHSRLHIELWAAISGAKP